MPIHKMIALHPDVGDDFKELLATAARHASFAADVHLELTDLAAFERPL